jgi:outer membrane protein OmpA-like peptidoglycan-associated protein
MSLKDILSGKGGGVSKDDHWIPLSDLMTGLMLVFLLIAVLYMVQVQRNKTHEIDVIKKSYEAQRTAEAQKNAAQIELEALQKLNQALLEKLKNKEGSISDIAATYDNTKKLLYEDLTKAFGDKIRSWGAEINPQDLCISFKEPDVLFDVGQDSLKPKFQAILDEFFPRYIEILRSQQYADSIEEVRIEGHTSSTWENANPDDAYIKNMELSQSRTRQTLGYLLSLKTLKTPEIRSWVITHLTANGLSSSKIKKDSSGKEDPVRSQRVEFRVRTNADEKFSDILEKAKNNEASRLQTR